MHALPVQIGPFLPTARLLKPVNAGFPSPADDYLDTPIDLARTLIRNPPATFLMKVRGDSAIDLGIFDGSIVVVDRSLSPRDGDPVVVDVNGQRSLKVWRVSNGGPRLAYGNHRYGEFDPGHEPEIVVFGVITNTVRNFRK